MDGRHRHVTTRETHDVEDVALIVLEGPDVGRRHRLGCETTIGRGANCDVAIDDSEISRLHARVSRLPDGSLVLSDQSSTNGTYVNGARIKSSPLTLGDKVRLGGRVVLQLTTYGVVEEQLLQRQRLEGLGRLAAGVAHDFNNMLAAISASASYMCELEARERAGAEAEECLADILTATDRAAHLARRVLAFVRAGSDRSLFDASQVCRETVALLRRTIERRVRIECDAQSPLMMVGNSVELHQALMNLCLNARDAVIDRPGAGRIALSARLVSTGAKPKVLIEVEDDGAGMSGETKQRMFEPFFTTKARGAGFGLGLASVAEIVRLHGGAIDVESAIGRGTQIRITLPAALSTAEVAVETLYPEPDEVVRGRGEAVLVVDDEPVLLRSVVRILRRAGFSASAAEDGQAAIARIESGSIPRLVLLDLDLPGMSGEDVAKYLATSNPGIVVLAMTGHDELRQAAVVRNCGAVAALSKPFDPRELVLAVHDALSAESSPFEEPETQRINLTELDELGDFDASDRPTKMS